MTDKDTLLKELDGVIGKIIAEGLNDLSMEKPNAAAHIAGMMEQDTVYFRTIVDLHPLKVTVDLYRRDGATQPVRIFEIQTAMQH